MTTTPDACEREHTLATAVARFNDLRVRSAMAVTAEEMATGEAPSVPALAAEETLELLALGEAISRKAQYGRQIDVRAARRAGASWAAIGAALGTSKQAAWEAHNRWIDALADRFDGLPPDDVAAARDLAGDPDDD